jgi:hypothetical protein
VRGASYQPEVRYRDAKGEIHVQKPAAPPTNARPSAQGLRRMNGVNALSEPTSSRSPSMPATSHMIESGEMIGETHPREATTDVQTVRVYPYGVARNRLIQAAKRLGVPAVVVREVGDADVLITLRSYYRNRMQAITDAEQRGMPIYVLRANTVNQMEQSLAELFNLSYDSNSSGSEEWEGVSNQTQQAIQAVLNGQRWVDLPPASSSIRRLQHDMARQAQLVSHSYGKEPHRRVRIFRE